jgi:NAD(P)-dependent dehydrogenase (short-subunit alcohol dehydrogenase family)
VALAFAARGDAVALLGRTAGTLRGVATEIGEAGGTALAIAGDTTDPQELREAVASVLSEFERLDALVTCAAAGPAAGPSASLELGDWRHVIDVDLTGTFLTCQAAAQAMLAQRYGRIVNISSFHAVATYPERAAYASAKAGVIGLTQALAIEWAAAGVTVNAIAPGPIRTPRTEWFLGQSEDVERRMLNRTPAGRIGTTDDIADLTLFLCSPQARHIVGQTIVVDGGWTKSAWFGDYAT